MTAESNLPTGDSAEGLTLDGVFDRVISDIQSGDWVAVDQTCDAILAEAEGNPALIPFADVLYIQALAKFSTHHLVQATECALESFEANSHCAETSDLLAVLFALLGDLSKSLFYGKMSAAFPAREELKGILPETLPTLANAFLKVVEKPLFNRGMTSAASQDWYGAIHWFEQQIMYEPEDQDGYKGLANIFSILGRFREALATLRSCVHATSADPDLISSIGILLTSLGEFDSARNCHYLAMKDAPEDIEIHAAALIDMFSAPKPNPEEIAQECKTFMERFSPDLPNLDLEADSGKEQLTIGYIIGPFSRRKCSSSFSEILAHRNDDRFTTVGFGFGTLTDQANAHMQKAFDVWHDTSDMDPYTLSSMIEAEDIDILVDMCGYDTPSLSRVFGSRVAPVQISWRGAPYGSGSPNMDYRISDAFCEEGIDPEFYGEKVICLDSSHELISVPNRLNIEKNVELEDTITFGADVSFGQLTGESIGAWAEILRATPDAMLALWDHDYSLPENADKLIELFGNYGLAHRVDILKVENKTEFYSNIDIQLYPLAPQTQEISVDPVNNGIPVVCLKGDSYLERSFANVMVQMGLGDNCMATSRDQYVELAIKWTDPDKRAQFAEENRNKAAETPIFNFKHRAEELEAAFEKAWKESAGS